MFLFLTVLSVIAAIAILSVKQIKNGLAAAIATGLAVVFAVLSTVNIVSPGTNKVQTVLGSVNPQPLEAGIHLVNPLTVSTVFDVRQQTLTFDDLSIQTQDKQKSQLDVSVTFQAINSATPEMFQSSGTLEQAVEKHVIPNVRSIIREVSRSIPLAQDLINDTTQNKMQDDIEAKLNLALAEKGFIVHAVMLRDIDLPEVVKQAVISTKERQEAIEREKAQLRVIEQQSMQQIVQAESKAKAAEQNAIAIKTMADAEAYRILAEAKATADGNKEIAKSLTREVIDYKQADRWDGKLPTTSLGNATPMISVK
jgi:regulator of protease activity HflC (stomatin/prohibitin superfamily)